MLNVFCLMQKLPNRNMSLKTTCVCIILYVYNVCIKHQAKGRGNRSVIFFFCDLKEAASVSLSKKLFERGSEFNPSHQNDLKTRRIASALCTHD